MGNGRLSVELAELKAVDFDLNLTGFNAAELQDLLVPATGAIDEDIVIEPASTR